MPTRDEPLTARDRAALLHDLAEYRVLHAEARRQARRFAATACGFCRRARAASATGDQAYFAKMWLRSGATAQEELALAAKALAAIRGLEADLTGGTPDD